MKARIVRVGNSRGVRIPKALLERSGLGDEVEIEVEKDQIIIKPVRRPREGWAEACEEMSRRGDDQLLDGDITGLSSFDEKE